VVQARVTPRLSQLPPRGASSAEDPPEKVPGERGLYGDERSAPDAASPGLLFEYPRSVPTR
jgi:hypothetical protein